MPPQGMPTSCDNYFDVSPGPEPLADIAALSPASLQDKWGATPLHRAARAAEPDQLEAALATGQPAEIDAANSCGSTALHRAARQGQFNTAFELLALGADASAATDEGDTARELATKAGRLGVARLLALVPVLGSSELLQQPDNVRGEGMVAARCLPAAWPPGTGSHPRCHTNTNTHDDTRAADLRASATCDGGTAAEGEGSYSCMYRRKNKSPAFTPAQLKAMIDRPGTHAHAKGGHGRKPDAALQRGCGGSGAAGAKAFTPLTSRPILE